MVLQSNTNQRRSILLFMILVTMLVFPIVYRVVYVEYYYDSVNQVTSEDQRYPPHNTQPLIDNPLISSNVDTTYSNVAISLGLGIILSVIIFVYYLKTGNARFSKIGTGRKELG